MKTVETETSFDAALAKQRVEEIKTKNRKLIDTVKWKTEQGIQKLLQIILRNVTINKDAEISLRMGEERFTIHYIYDITNKYSMDIEFCFAKKWDVFEIGAERNEKAIKANINIGDIKDVSFSGFKMDFFKGDKFEDFDCLLLYGYIGKQLRDNDGEFINTLKEIYAEMRVFWDEIDKGWSEGRELNSQIEKHARENFENEIRNSNKYFKEGNFIVIRDIKKDFIEASVYQIGKVQKTTFYAKQCSIEIEDLSRLSEENKLYALQIRTYNRDEKRRLIDTYITSWASSLVKGNKIEILTTEEWNKLEKEIRTERDLIVEYKLNEQSKKYGEVKYRKEQ